MYSLADVVDVTAVRVPIGQLDVFFLVLNTSSDNSQGREFSLRAPFTLRRVKG